MKDSSWSMQQRKGLLTSRFNPSSPKLDHLREKLPVNPYVVKRKGVRRTNVYLRVMLRFFFFPLFCFAPSIDFKDILLGANIVARNNSLPREKLWLIHQFKTTWTVTTGHKSCRKTAAWLSNNKLRTNFSPEGKASSLRKKRWVDSTRDYKKAEILCCLKDRQKCRQYLRIIPCQKMSREL